MTCAVADCERAVHGRGWCTLHYQRWLKRGDPLLTAWDLLDREALFFAKVEKRADGCWEWTAAAKGPNGYGGFGHEGKIHYAHRWIYERWVGPVPEGLELDHLCRNPRCVNPAHLEVVTHRENCLRGTSPTAVNAAKTHCKHGHPFDEDNTRWYHGHRRCETCEARWREERNARRREARPASAPLPIS